MSQRRRFAPLVPLAAGVVGLTFAALPIACGDENAPAPGGGGAGASGASSGGGGAGAGGLAGTSGGAATASVEGDVLSFLTEVQGARIASAKVSVLERPELSVVTGNDAHFRLDGLVVGEKVTLVVEHPGYKTTQTSTVVVPPAGIHPFPVQVVSNELFDALAGIVPQPPELDKYCAIASTVGRFGTSLYVYARQGVPGASVALSPAVPAENGPLYFNEAVIPDAKQTSTSIDGGVIFYRLPPGEYTMSATRESTVFGTVSFACRAGVVVNAGPPFGPLANVPNTPHDGANERPADAFSAASDLLCAVTQQCVNERAMATNYPDVTVASCKATYRSVWASVDTGCDASTGLREAARAFYACRSTGCATSLGDDTVCVGEEEAFRLAESTYGACLAAK